jgi:ADP-L-glycero-D-manno-heptose 6-epimerase
MILVTGAAGFIGSNIVADLNESGRSDAVLVDVLESGVKWRNIAKRRFLDFVFPDEIESYLKSARNIEAIVHLGANSSTTATDGDAILRSNFRTSQVYWNWCAETRTPLIYASSAATYGDGANGFKDDQSLESLDALRPLNLYGWTKHAFDKWAVERALEGHAPPQWVGLKFFNVYGPNESHKGEMRSLVTKNFTAIRNGQEIQLFRSHKEGYKDGEQLRDFVYVKDCTKAIRWLLQNRNVCGLFNLGTGQARSFSDLMFATGAAAGCDVKIRYVDMPEAIRATYQYFTQSDMTKLREAGYQEPFSSVEEGVGDYVRMHLALHDATR